MACDHNCSTCAANGGCEKKNLLSPANAKSKVKRVIAVMSGKGGVGKSLVASQLAVAAARSGLKTAVLDADITGPSIPMAFGITERAQVDSEHNILPCKSTCGISVMSLNLLIDNPEDPVAWRGPVIAGAVRQFWSDVAWGDIDLMFVDMPPGTGDVPLTVFQSLPIAGAIIVTTPQDLVSMIVEKAVRLAEMMKIPVLGIVENMSSFKCPGCGALHRIFGDGCINDFAAQHAIKTVVSLPIDPAVAAAVDRGQIESLDVSALDPLVSALTVEE